MKLPRALQGIIEARGCYIDDETTRGGIRKDARNDKRLHQIDPAVQAKFTTLLDTMFEGNGVPFNYDKPPCELTEIESVDIENGSINDGDDEGAMDENAPELNRNKESRKESLEEESSGSEIG